MEKLLGTELKKEFPLRDDITFINHGSYGVVPNRIKEAQKRLIDEMDSFPDMWFRKTRHEKIKKARQCIAEFVHADMEDIVFVQNATTGVNTALKTLRYDKDDVILYTDNTYNAVKNACHQTVDSTYVQGVRTDFISLKFPIQSEDDVVQMYRDYFEKNKNVKVAVLDHISSASAIKFPIEKLIPLCREFGVISIIDGAHAPGQVPLNLRELDPDFYTGNLHKWLYCPRGCAILYVNRKFHPTTMPLVTGHGHKSTLQNDFSLQGTRDDSPYFVVPEAVQFYNDLGGYERIRSYTDKLLSESTDLMTSQWKTEKLPIPTSMEAPFMRMVQLPMHLGKSVHNRSDGDKMVVQIMENYKIVPCVTVVDGKAYLRLSCNVYNTMADYKMMTQLVLDHGKKYDQSQ